MAINVDKTLIKPSFVQKLRSKTDLESDWARQSNKKTDVCFFCLRPSAKDQGITQVVVVVAVVFLLLVFPLVHYLVHFLFIINLREKFFFPGNQNRDLLFPSRAFYQLSYSEIVTHNIENYLFKDILYNCTKIFCLMISKTTPQTSHQSWHKSCLSSAIFWKEKESLVDNWTKLLWQTFLTNLQATSWL